jgi:hypothetical protein
MGSLSKPSDRATILLKEVDNTSFATGTVLKGGKGLVTRRVTPRMK